MGAVITMGAIIVCLADSFVNAARKDHRASSHLAP